MRAAAARSPIRIKEPIPFGDVVLAPPELTGVSQAQLARSMAEHLLATSPGTDAEALSALRRAFPYSRSPRALLPSPRSCGGSITSRDTPGARGRRRAAPRRCR